MNYLAHAYLNGQRNDAILMGNMMGDFVKGSQYKLFNANIQEGIILHRSIDVFTDQHPAVEQAKQFFRKDHRLFSGILTDTLFDYFLANDVSKFSNYDELKVFTQHIYKVINEHEHLMNDKMKTMTFYMQKHDWLYEYRLQEGIIKSFQGLFKRIPLMGDVETGIATFINQIEPLRECYTWLIADLQNKFWV
jgi:acyl carrier protein phosphodiesterase